MIKISCILEDPPSQTPSLRTPLYLNLYIAVLSEICLICPVYKLQMQGLKEARWRISLNRSNQINSMLSVRSTQNILHRNKNMVLKKIPKNLFWDKLDGFFLFTTCSNYYEAFSLCLSVCLSLSLSIYLSISIYLDLIVRPNSLY